MSYGAEAGTTNLTVEMMGLCGARWPGGGPNLNCKHTAPVAATVLHSSSRKRPSEDCSKERSALSNCIRLSHPVRITVGSLQRDVDVACSISDSIRNSSTTFDFVLPPHPENNVIIIEDAQKI